MGIIHGIYPIWMGSPILNHGFCHQNHGKHDEEIEFCSQNSDEIIHESSRRLFVTIHELPIFFDPPKNVPQLSTGAKTSLATVMVPPPRSMPAPGTTNGGA